MTPSAAPPVVLEQVSVSIGGRPILLVAHEIGPMMSLVDRSVVMRDGRVAYDGPPLTQEVAAHTHHAHDHDLPGGHDHVPHVASPLDFERRTQP